MNDEELKALVERLDQMGRIDGVLTMSLTTIIAVEDTQAAASAIRQLMRERDWQPIETHPQTPGEPFLCCEAGGTAPYVASWSPGSYADDPNNEVWDLWLNGEFYGLSCRPDFWLPLPKHPLTPS